LRDRRRFRLRTCILSSAEAVMPPTRKPGPFRSRARADPLEPSRPLARFRPGAGDRSRPLCQGPLSLEPSQIVKVLLLLARFAACPPRPVLVWPAR